MRRILGLVLIGGAALGLAQAQDSKVVPGPFRAYVVTGIEAKPAPEGLQPEERRNLGDIGRIGKFHDFVTQYGLDPTVAVFMRTAAPTADQPAGKLLAALEKAVEKNKNNRLHAFAIFLGLKEEFNKDESQAAQIKSIQELAKQMSLKEVPLSLDQAESERTKAYQIPADAAMTVIVYVNQIVSARFDFTADKPLDDAAVLAVMNEVAKLVPAAK